MTGEGERIVWVGLVRYKMDAASKTLQRIPGTDIFLNDQSSLHVDLSGELLRSKK